MSAEGRIRKRIPKSCKRCHRRKQRCVGYPTCTGCESAKQPCLRSESVPSWHHAMSKGALVRRIEVLEAQLSAALEQIPPDEEAPAEPLSTGAKLQPHDSRAGVVSMMAMSQEGSDNLAYLGPSSGMSIAEDLGRLVQNAVWLRSIPINGSHHQPPPECERTAASTTLPSEAVDQMSEAARFKLFMVYAIGAAILQMTETYDSTPPSAFVAMALQLESVLGESQSYMNIEALMLLVLYHMRTSSATRVWYLIGLAMRICIDLGLHRESQYRKMRPYEGQMRRRLFWSVYLVERYVAWSLGRPFSVPEEDIDVHAPSDLDDSCTSDELVEQALQGSVAPREPAHGRKLRRFIALAQLQRIMSQIHTRVYRTDKHTTTLVPETTPLLAALEEFETSLPEMAPEENDFVHMHWNNANRMLIQRFVGVLPQRDPLIERCLYASGQMCQCFKRLRQRDSSGYSFLLVNSLYMAGLTICLCLFRAPQLWTVAVSNDLRACSSALFVMAERNSSLKKYRDGLEMIINRVMEYVNDAAKADPMPSDSHTKDVISIPHSESVSAQTDVTTGDTQFSAGWFDFQYPLPPMGGLTGPDLYGQRSATADTPDFWHTFSDMFPEIWSNDLLSMDMSDGLNWFTPQ
ncbi:Zn(II)2Cys6 transcription factor [Aspergillus costaricaensis CBS 115574]|uniref:Zn(II)2Cys6 transcription factor n=1 Tax=Aspergillus costaricaensis CBS 115574 TaxID=1448317 RepID=A0ACD1IGK3_9EURO|nr:Zn(II)2Cys6 transcription factor [Aspergillus costaricaensis CBS 115574]RAK89748.1 Zn(II)2Cys6 transcription factor [Aspergillus costaricaensis CBS 115574]